MAVRPNNGTLFKGFIFDGIDSKDFGVYLTQEAAYSAPVRDVEMYEIAGRNGAYALDKGRFLNIEVTYKAAITATDEASFAEGISALRNALCSRVGYKRIEDEYNPDEYRLAIYKSGLEVAAADILKAGEFDLVFDCKPQRYLISGETAQAVTSGGTLTNPTLFESRPLLQVWGYGDININTDTITINDTEIGEVILYNGGSAMHVPTIQFSEANLRTGDTITVGDGSTQTSQFKVPEGDTVNNPTIQGIQDTNGIVKSASVELLNSRVFKITTVFNPITFSTGTTEQREALVSVSFDYTPAGGSSSNCVVTTYESFQYWPGRIAIYNGYTNPSSVPLSQSPWDNIKPITAYSTKPTLGEPLFFDLDIGEAYKEEGGEYISVNNAVTFPAELPTLKAGANAITYDNTVTQFKVVPRWWRV